VFVLSHFYGRPVLHLTAKCFRESGRLLDKKTGPDMPVPEEERKSAVRNRAAGLAVALLLLVLIIYIATCARLGT